MTSESSTKKMSSELEFSLIERNILCAMHNVQVAFRNVCLAQKEEDCEVAKKNQVIAAVNLRIAQSLHSSSGSVVIVIGFSKPEFLPHYQLAVFEPFEEFEPLEECECGSRPIRVLFSDPR